MSDAIPSFLSRNASKPPCRSYDSPAHVHILGNRACSRIIALDPSFLLGRLRPALPLSIVDHIRNPFSVPGRPGPSVERIFRGEYLDAFTDDLQMVMAAEILKAVQSLLKSELNGKQLETDQSNGSEEGASELEIEERLAGAR